MTTQTINGRDPLKGAAATDGGAVRARAQAVNPPQSGPMAPQRPANPRDARAIPRRPRAHPLQKVRNFLQLHAGELGESLTEGWAVTYRLPTPAEAALKVWPTKSTPWFWWPVDALAAVPFLVLIFVAYLAINALGAAPRRRVGLALLGLTVAIYVVANLTS